MLFIYSLDILLTLSHCQRTFLWIRCKLWSALILWMFCLISFVELSPSKRIISGEINSQWILNSFLTHKTSVGLSLEVLCLNSMFTSCAGRFDSSQPMFSSHTGALVLNNVLSGSRGIPCTLADGGSVVTPGLLNVESVWPWLQEHT